MKLLNLKIFGTSKVLIAIIMVAVLATACKTADKANYSNDEEMYLNAKKLFLDKKYKEAASLIDLLQLQYPASRYADDAQFLLAEINFADEQFLIAVFNYNRLLKNFPASEYAKESMFKAALCYLESSPNYDRDQNYTRQAIKALQEFQYLYPNDSLAKESDKKIAELREKLANREYFTAELYRKLDSPISSVMYYDEVINNFADTKFYEPAFYGKIDALNQMGKKEQLKSLISVYKTTFPKGEHLSEVQSIEKDLK
jgi:outer membrane protein assembly factor BamD